MAYLTKGEFSNSCVQDLFEAQVARTPKAICLTAGDRSFTFEEVNVAANRIAHHLASLGAEQEELVGLVFDRSIEAVIAILAVLKTGAGYVMLDPRYPFYRSNIILETARPVAVLTSRRDLHNMLPDLSVPFLSTDESFEHHSADALGIKSEPDNVAYVTFTSGTANQPKAVIATHRSITNGLASVPFRRDSPDEICGLMSPLTFGFSVAQLFLPLLCGVRVCLINEADVKEPRRLVTALAAGHVSSVGMVTPLFRQILELGPALTAQLKELRTVIVGGAKLSQKTKRIVRELLPGVRLMDGYAMSEAGGAVLVEDKPFPNTQLYVLDENLSPVPEGGTGEIYVSALHLSRGYFRQPALTAQTFVADPFATVPGARMYRTGDLARVLSLGIIELAGRVDTQVKIRGYRLDLEAVETTLEEHEDVAAAAASTDEVRDEVRLVAYVVTRKDVQITTLREHMLSCLPEYMVPSVFVFLDYLPMTHTGKVDRRALPSLELVRPTLNKPYVPPRNDAEAAIAQIWADALGLDRVSIDDDFLELGGDSLLAVHVTSRIWELFGTEVSFKALLETSTVAKLVEVFLKDVSAPGQVDHPEGPTELLI